MYFLNLTVTNADSIQFVCVLIFLSMQDITYDLWITYITFRIDSVQGFLHIFGDVVHSFSNSTCEADLWLLMCWCTVWCPFRQSYKHIQSLVEKKCEESQICIGYK